MEENIAVMISTGNPCREERDHTVDAVATERVARQRLDLHPHLGPRSSAISIRFEGEVLIISGRVPSFYLKQLVQEALRDLTSRIQNDIDVICCSGLSSVRSTTSYD